MIGCQSIAPGYSYISHSWLNRRRKIKRGQLSSSHFHLFFFSTFVSKLNDECSPEPGPSSLQDILSPSCHIELSFNVIVTLTSAMSILTAKLNHLIALLYLAHPQSKPKLISDFSEPRWEMHGEDRSCSDRSNSDASIVAFAHMGNVSSQAVAVLRQVAPCLLVRVAFHFPGTRILPVFPLDSCLC